MKSFIDIFIDSAATGIGGILLIAFTAYLGLQVQYISFIVIGFITFWMYLIMRVRREYVHSFRQALEKRSIDLDVQMVNVKDASVVESLVKVLDGQNERQILYALHIVENVKNEEFIPYFRKLLHSPSAEIKVQVLRILNKYEGVDFSTEIEQLLQDESFEVKVQALCYMLHYSQNGRETLFRLLNDSDHHVRSAAFLCIAYEYRDNKEFRERIDAKQVFEQFVDQCYRMDLNENEFLFAKKNMAEVIGTLKIPDLYPFLTNLLNDNSQEVKRAAMRSAGFTRNLEFVPVLIKHLKEKHVRLHARDALKEYGEEIVDILARHFEDQSEDKRIRIEIIRLLASIGSQKSVHVLDNHLGHSDLHVRYETVKALNKLKVRFSNLKLDNQSLHSRIIDEVKYYNWMVGLLPQQKAFSTVEGGDKSSDEYPDGFHLARNLLMNALIEKLDVYLKLIFRLLGLRYSSKEIYNAYLGVVSNKSDLRANAVEFLDNILDADFKRLIIPIIEETAPNLLIQKTRHIHDFNLEIEQKSIQFLLKGEDNWLKVCALYYIAEMKNDTYRDKVLKLEDDTDSLVKETAQYYLERIDTPA
ncbi:MAG: HEAT repeat domain-containing protein [Gemmatimonadota bacterium]|nr:MAG: HEAT repeat domain-containing protein [Gemmatimonadota bacterium]